MSEFISGNGRLLIAGLVATAALAGCSESTTLDHTAVPLVECYDAALPSKAMPNYPLDTDPNHAVKVAAWNKAYDIAKKPENTTPVNLNYDPSTKRFDEEPRIDPNIDAKYRDANVRVNNDHGDAHGSGWVTINKRGEDVVVTAAHVVANNDITTLQISNSKGEEARVTGGCYVYENEGQKVPLTVENDDANGGNEYDIAVLRVSRRIGSALPIAKTMPKRGTWVTFTNSQLESKPDYPANYAGVIVSKAPNLYGNEVLTGLQPWKKQIEGETSYSANPGCSGGLVGSTKKAEIVGMSVSGPEGYIDEAITIKSYNVYIGAKAGNDTGIVPLPVTIIAPEMLRAAVNSPKY